MLAIGPVIVASPLVLAPMAGISDQPFRRITRSFGCGLAFTEMINARSLLYNNKTTKMMLTMSPDDRPLGVQLLGGDPEVIMRALEVVSRHPFDIIDFNAACPVKKVVSAGKGASLLREPLKFERLLKLIVDIARVPVTVKIRSGWDNASVNAVEIAQRAQDAGVEALFIHGRTRIQGYSGEVDYDLIRQVKETLTIPVIASGDALSPYLIKRMLDETGCDAVTIARGALGNPWIFRQTAEYLKGGTLTAGPAVAEVARVMKDHLALNVSFHGEEKGVMLYRKLFTWYARGMAVKDLRRQAFRAKTHGEMLRLIEAMENSVKSRNSWPVGNRSFVSVQPPEGFGR